MWRTFGRDRVGTAGLVGALSQGHRPDLTMWILHSPDKTMHIAWKSVMADADAPLDHQALLDQAAAWAGPIHNPAPYGWGTPSGQLMEADAQLGEALEVGEFDYVIITSDHGMTWNPAFGEPGQPAGQHITEPAFHGILAVRGPGVVAGQELPPVSVLDLAPTMAYMLGLPVAEDLPGQVVTGLFDDDHLAEHPIETVPGW